MICYLFENMVDVLMAAMAFERFYGDLTAIQ